MFGLVGWSLSIIAGSEMRPDLRRIFDVQLKHAAAQIATNEFENADQIAMNTVEGRPIPMSIRNQSFHNYGIQAVR